MPTAATPANGKDEYNLSRTFSANVRINLQHYLWYEGLGHLIHPSIPTNKENLRVADIGFGTGIWLMEMSRKLPPSARLDGFDVSHAQSPPVELMPSNISLHIHDFLGPPTEEMQGVYDIVHLQQFVTVVKDNNPIPVLENVLAILKPGGYITWGEYDFTSCKYTLINPEVTDWDDQCTKLSMHNATLGGLREASFQHNPWVSNLASSLTSVGMTNVEAERVPFTKETTTFLYDVLIVASLEIADNVLDKLGGGRGDRNRELTAYIAQHRKDIQVEIDRFTVIGMKPLE